MEHQQPAASCDILATFKSAIAKSISAASNDLLTYQDAFSSLENCKVKGFDFSFPMLKMRKFQPFMNLDPISTANEWASQVRYVFHLSQAGRAHLFSLLTRHPSYYSFIQTNLSDKYRSIPTQESPQCII